VAALAALFVLAPVACNSQPQTTAASQLVVAVVDTPPTLDTDFFFGTPQSWEVADNLYDTLLYYKTSGDTRQWTPPFESRLATSIESDAANTLWTVKFRHGVKSQLGNEMTAEDWKWSWKRAFAVQGIGSFLGAEMQIPNADAVTVTDPYTVQIKAKSFSFQLPYFATLVFIPPYDVKAVTPHTTTADPWAKDWLATHAAGYGPYYLESLTPGVQAVLRANPNYYLGKAPIDKVIYKAVPDVSNRAALMSSGAVDIARDLSTAQLNSLKGNSKVAVYTATSNNEIAVTMNSKNPPLNNPLVRQALSYAVPYDDILTNIFHGFAAPLHSYSAPQFPGYDTTFWTYKTDLAKARQLLQQANVTLPINVSITYADFHPENEAMLVAIKTSFAQIGVNVTLDPVTIAKFASLSNQRAAQMFLTAALQSHPIEPVHGLQQFADANPNFGFLNYGNYDNPKVSALFAQARTTPSASDRAELVRQATKAMIDNPPWLVVGLYPFAIAHTPQVSGIRWAPDEGLKFYEIQKSG
jgi:peptide/nickel transport system substrate-binding protein